MRLTRILFVGFMLSLCWIIPVSAEDESPEGARVRLANYVLDAAEVDFLLDDESLGTLAFRAPAQHQAVSAGEHSVVVTLAGEDAALIEPVKLELAANHDYTIAFIGQLADGSVQILLLDETAIVADVRDLNIPASYAILVHGISDGPTVDFSMDGEIQLEALSFGEYGVAPVSLEPHDIVVTFSDDPSQVLFQNNGEIPPSDDLLLLTVMVGAYPDDLDVTGAVSRLPDRSVLDFLATYADENGNSFETLLAAIETAGLAETLTEEGVYTLYAPTDAAFDALPEDTREALFADADTLKAVLLAHVSPTIFTTRDLTDAVTVETLGGTEITIAADENGLTVNGNASLLFGGFPVVTNGNVIGVDSVLLPQD